MMCNNNNLVVSGIIHTVPSLVPRPIPRFSMFQRETLKNWEWAWGRGYTVPKITICDSVWLLPNLLTMLLAKVGYVICTHPMKTPLLDLQFIILA